MEELEIEIPERARCFPHMVYFIQIYWSYKNLSKLYILLNKIMNEIHCMWDLPTDNIDQNKHNKLKKIRITLQQALSKFNQLIFPFYLLLNNKIRFVV